ncbi:MAG TPA: sigma-70 family RNA polymerase sigma factor [Pseudonocardiaceae bacterium]|nr:sigma-70 family RNA polymerase sigma factor [Pseudonocardiaceae bacterium]
MARARARLTLVPADRFAQWRVLGPVEAAVAGRLVDLGPPRQRALFGLLLSRVDQPVALDALIDELWAGDPPGAAMASLRVYVSNLRRVLEPGRPRRAPATVLRTLAPGYLLDSRGVEFDVHQFTVHATAGREALGRADPEQALDEFDTALELWRGQAYADMRDAKWAAPEVARLDELRLSVVEARCAAQLELGGHHAVVAELDLHVRAHPLREHGCELLTVALYRAGRQAEALAVLRDTRAQLAEELGIDPGATLRQLERDILAQAPALDWHPPHSTPTASIAGAGKLAPQSRIASPPADEPDGGGAQRVVSTQVQGFAEIVGREQELAALRAGVHRPATAEPAGVAGAHRVEWGGQDQPGPGLCPALPGPLRAGVVGARRGPEAVAGEFRALLDILAPQYAEHSHDPVQAVHAVLANRTGPWLLVIDNIAEPEALRGLLPAAAVLAHELGGLPLALAQAGCYVAHSALDLAGYLALYRYRRAELHREGHAPDYPATVATTWQLAFDQLTPLARALLNLLAWYAPDTIPLDQLLAPDTDHLQLPEPVHTPLRPLLTDPLQQHRAITELVAYGLLSRAGPRGSVTVHRLVQAVTADQLTAGNHPYAWIIAAATLLDAACPRWPDARVTTMITGKSLQTLQTHVRVLLEHLHPDQPITLNLRYTLASWIGMAGDNARARKLGTALVEDSERMLGADHPGTMIARRGLAYWTGKVGNVVSARELAAAVVQDMTRVLGPDDWHTLLARTNLARWTGAAGDAVSARQLAAAVHADAQRVLGPDDRYTLVTRANLAHWTGRPGTYRGPGSSPRQRCSTPSGYSALTTGTPSSLGPTWPAALTTGTPCSPAVGSPPGRNPYRVPTHRQFPAKCGGGRWAQPRYHTGERHHDRHRLHQGTAILMTTATIRDDLARATDSVADLLLGIVDGDPAAWDELLRRYGKLVSTTVRSFHLQEADALDAMQMTWLRLAEKAERVQYPERLGSWLATTARHECLHILRQVRLGPNLSDVRAETATDLSAGPEQHTIDADTIRTLQELVDELSPRRRTLIRMLFTDTPGSYAEIARVAGIPPGGIGTTRARALRQMRDKLDSVALPG